MFGKIAFYISIVLLIECFTFSFSSASNIVENQDSVRIILLNNNAKQLMQSNIDSSQMLLNQALNISVQKKLKYGEALTLKNLGTVYFRLAVYTETEKNWKKSLNIYQNIGDNEGISDLFNNIGVFYFQMKQIDSALKYHSEALKYRIQLGDSVQIASSYGNIGILYRNQGKYDEALEYCHKALKIREKKNDKLGMADSYNSIGLIYYYHEKYEKAIEYYNLALNIRIEINDKKGIAGSYNNLAGVYKYLKNYEKAKDFFNLFLNLSIEINDKRGVAGANNNLGIICRDEGVITESLSYFLKSQKLFSELNDKQGIAISTSNIGMLYLKLNKPDDALKYLNEAIKVAEAIKDIDVERASFKGISEVYEKKNNFKFALEYFKKYKDLNDSVFNKESNAKIAEMNEKYESEKKQQEIVFLKTDAENQKQKTILSNKVRNWAIASSILSLLILFFGFNYFKQKRKLFLQREKILSSEKEEFRLLTEMQRKEIESKSRELTGYATSALEKNELLAEIEQKIRPLKDSSSNSDKATIKELEKIIKSHMNLDDQWDNFKIHFESVHSGFFTILKSKFPTLSVNDLKNCAYIRMNLSSKEISTLMNIDPKSAKMIRYRLKKKLNLQPEDSLHDFIASID